ncbi:MAG: GGDEF domain-containing protein [Burkholderiaceae bacterium]|nr:GGDEF domain-containing protein [Burkholderiaceae bacterium]
MPELIDTVAGLNASRDREALEVAVLSALVEVLDPLRATFCRLVAMADSVRVHERLRVERGGVMQIAPLPRNLRTLAALERHGRAGAAGTGATQGQAVVDCSFGGRHIYVAPIRGATTRVAWIELETDGPLDEARVRMFAGLVRVYANHIAVLDYSERDGLTALRNRKTFDDSFLRLLSRTDRETARVSHDHRAGSREAAPHWLALADIDRFKRVNDRFGHLFGDEVLVMIARLMRQSFRVNDLLYRFGGEEFAVLLDRTPERHAGEVFERFRAAVQAQRFAQVGEVTISIGYTRIRDADTPSEAFERADSALYHAKQGGRNRICAYETLAASGQVDEKRLNESIELF